MAADGHEEAVYRWQAIPWGGELEWSYVIPKKEISMAMFVLVPGA